MKPTVRRLKNGMSVILVPQKGAESMTMMVLTKVGSRYETRELNGASHFIEHLMFKGTKRRPQAQQLSALLDRFGAEYNAFTGKDLTAYYIKIEAEKTALAVDLLHDMLFHSLFDKKEIDRERGVIVEEINMYEDNPRMHLDDMLEEAMFPDSTLGWNIAGPREVIRKVTREQLIAYRDAYYIPERMTVVIAGKVVPGVMEMLEKTFGKVHAPAKRVDAPFTPFVALATLNHGLALQDKPTEQVQLALAFHGVPMEHASIPALAVLTTVLSGGMSSRLFVEIRERRGLCYSIRASHDAFEDTGLFSVSAGLAKDRVPEAVAEILKQLKKVRTALVTAEELRRAKDNIRGRTLLAFEDSSTQADWYGRQWTFQKKVETPEEKMKRIERVTAAQVRAAAQAILRPERMASAVIGPFPKKEELQRVMTWTL